MNIQEPKFSAIREDNLPVSTQEPNFSDIKVDNSKNVIIGERITVNGQTDWDARILLAKDLRLDSFKLGGKAAANFPYIVGPIENPFNEAIQALNGPPTPGFIVFAAANAGKTRLALEALRQALPEWHVLRYRPDSALPPKEYLNEKQLVFFVDDLQEYVSTQVATDPRATSFRTTVENLIEDTQHLVIIATCRKEDETKVQIAFSWLIDQLVIINIPRFNTDAKNPEAEQIIAEFRKQNEELVNKNTNEWDGTLGSLLLGLSSKRSQYLFLLNSDKLAGSTLHAMKLLTRANTTLHTEPILQAVCKELFGITNISTQTWDESVNNLLDMQFVIKDYNGPESRLVILKDTYFEKVIIKFTPEKEPLPAKKRYYTGLKKIFVERKNEEA